MNKLIYSFQPQDRLGRPVGVVMVMALHVLLAWALLSGTAQKTIEIFKKPLEALLIQEVIIPPAPALTLPTKNIHLPLQSQPKVFTPLSVLNSEAALPMVLKPSEIAPESPNPKIKTTVPVLAASVQLTPAIDVIKPQVASLEAEYASKVRTMLNLTKRYPTGRQASQQRPQGKVKVWFTLTRNGTLLEVGVLESSNSNLLDDAAISSVRRGTYPTFPDQTWPGQDQHKFSADIDFLAPGVG